MDSHWQTCSHKWLFKLQPTAHLPAHLTAHMDSLHRWHLQLQPQQPHLPPMQWPALHQQAAHMDNHLLDHRFPNKCPWEARAPPFLMWLGPLLLRVLRAGFLMKEPQKFPSKWKVPCTQMAPIGRNQPASRLLHVQLKSHIVINSRVLRV